MLQDLFEDISSKFGVWDQGSTVMIDEVMIQLQI